MSPFLTWDISCAKTARICGRVMDCINPVETATSASFLNAPVAKAFAEPRYTATSGVLTPALPARSATVCTSHASSCVCGAAIVRAPVDALAIVLDINKEMNAPVNPKTAENASS